MRVTRLLGIRGKVFQNSVSQLRSRDSADVLPWFAMVTVMFRAVEVLG